MNAALQEPARSPPEVAIGEDDLYEIVDGKRLRQPPMAVYAVWLANTLCQFLSTLARANQLGRALQEALFHLPQPVGCDRRPDVAFVSYQRWAKSLPMPRTDNAWNVVPNVAVEVVSPNDVVDELHEKINEYFRAGVELVWVVYPQQSQVYVYSSATQVHVLTVADVLEGNTVLPGFHLPLAELFSES